MSRLATASRRNRFVILRTAGSPPVAPHPASQRRSYLRLWSCDQPQNGLAPFRQNVLEDALIRGLDPRARLDRAIQVARSSRATAVFVSSTGVGPAVGTNELAMTRKKSIRISNSRYTFRILAAGDARGLRSLSLKRGSRECRMRAAPAVSRAKAERKSHTSIQGSEAIRHPAQWLYGLFRALPGVSAFLPPSPHGNWHSGPDWAFAPPLRLDANH